MPARLRPAKSHTLYRCFSATGELLYVGMTGDLKQRFNAHRYSSSWWKDVTRWRMELLPSEEALRLAEGLAIRHENPVHNVRRYEDPQRWPRPDVQQRTPVAARTPGQDRQLARTHLAWALGINPNTLPTRRAD